MSINASMNYVDVGKCVLCKWGNKYFEYCTQLFSIFSRTFGDKENKIGESILNFIKIFWTVLFGK